MRALLILLALCGSFVAAELPLDDRPAGPGEWGYHPADGEQLVVTPPGFSWRAVKGAKSYELTVTGEHGTRRYEGIGYSVFCPDEPLPPGYYEWRYRYRDGTGAASVWSRRRAFSIAGDAPPFPLPKRDALLARIPTGHPRLFVRPEEIPVLRASAAGPRKKEFERLVARCRSLVKKPPPTEEPARYPKGMKRGGEEWRKLWWGNRTYTIRVLDSAATLAFTALLADDGGERGGDGEEHAGSREFRALAKRLLLDAARWNPRGATGYRYNDEAGMPYAYHFSRTYTFLHDALTDEERTLCRDVMRVRGREMYAHLCPRHLWSPYASHSNRAWHFLGEVGIAFHGEIEEADDWVWFAANVFRNVYPVWSDDDGGWHEGINYWSSYVGRFTWWADVMKKALRLDAYDMPYFARAGYYPLYFMPPGQRGGGFGDLCGRRKSEQNVPLVAVLASQAGNGHWQWYVDAQGGAPAPKTYIDFLRGAGPPVAATPPAELPASRLFAGTGQAALNTNLLDAKENVQVLFKSSSFGTQSHGYDAQNSFLLNVHGERILVRSGHRDQYGSDHHRNWMWHTKSVNSITVNGKSQARRSTAAKGKIVEFHAGDRIDYVAGEAGGAYGDALTRFTRRVLFVKPDVIVIFDTLVAPEPSTFEWHLHSAYPIDRDGFTARTEGEKAGAQIDFLSLADMEFSVTDRFDPPPRERIKLTQWHFTAATKERKKEAVFVAVIRPFEKGAPPLGRLRKGSQTRNNVFTIQTDVTDGTVWIDLLLRDGEIRSGMARKFSEGAGKRDISTLRRRMEVRLLDRSGELQESFATEE